LRVTKDSLVELKDQEAAKRYRGKLAWEGDLDAMRTNRDSR
jgi:hypothetical protein